MRQSKKNICPNRSTLHIFTKQYAVFKMLCWRVISGAPACKQVEKWHISVIEFNLVMLSNIGPCKCNKLNGWFFFVSVTQEIIVIFGQQTNLRPLRDTVQIILVPFLSRFAPCGTQCSKTDTSIYSRHSTSKGYCCHGIFLCNRP